jgi:O-acetyl-ADP-ribose deacetylase (regulator of RNase III)
MNYTKIIMGLGLVSMLATSPCFGNQIYYAGKKSKTCIRIVHGDITQQHGIDALVNAANVNLQHGGGVAAAISKAAGPQLQIFCNKESFGHKKGMPRCPVGQAVITPAYNLNTIGIKSIIHAVGPRIPDKQSPTKHDARVLYDAYTNSLKIAYHNKLRSVAFPAISTAIFNYDIQLATPIAFKAVADFIANHPHAFDEIRFVLFSEKDFLVYTTIANKRLHKKSDSSVQAHDIAHKQPDTHHKKENLPAYDKQTWGQWMEKNPYLTALGVLGMVTIILGVYHTCA